MATEYYHASQAELSVGTPLDSRFFKFPHVMEAMLSLLSEPDTIRLPVIKQMLLMDQMRYGLKIKLAFYIKEAILEAVRKERFSHRTSRAEATFLAPAPEHLSHLKESRPHLYRCDVSAPPGEVFKADTHFVVSPDLLAPVTTEMSKLHANAVAYWKGEQCDDPTWEYVVPVGKVTIAAAVEWPVDKS